uniref:Sjoegren syndrome/scleroderma autoantigen 1 n=1 Tax=Steinernema glaseri TaxID=37863 RepID=A0A1I8AVM4_9BILA
MVHRRFVKPADSEKVQSSEKSEVSAAPWEGKEEDEVVKIWKPKSEKVEKMNGAKLVDANEVRQLQSQVRDEVSKRMGDLLLKGYTMLDQYCDQCQGILMESRSNELICLQCTVVAEISKAEKPVKPENLTEMDDISDHEPSPKRVAVSTASMERVVPKEELMEVSASGRLALDEYAVQVVARKLKWACDALDASVNPSEVTALISVVASASKFLKENKP